MQYRRIPAAQHLDLLIAVDSAVHGRGKVRATDHGWRARLHGQLNRNLLNMDSI